jgi:hypothetical protein
MDPSGKPDNRLERIPQRTYEIPKQDLETANQDRDFIKASIPKKKDKPAII